ncbi:TPA: cytosine deaminase [Citrobacter freundii]|jgi:cytosine deaminase|uniref:Cytosine deaminase n=2 Tax=Citrobacter freundii complex TaxID=1344959 RepID=A0AAI9HMD7_CITFR|nr:MULTISPECIES: cytosine deaminase [Enterobacteriaceae]EKV7202933.1 cytosine deaminase [Citrobacter freundii]EKW4406444.1 cytosine deaminase [Citrobacter freundii]MCQ6312309.1 cytosine deaminase [Citrobacter portucalensis]MCX3187693.1 cytosine deaminase [Escherichia coli]MDT7227938.1 cytosine deaminase [Citrobacter freundii]
MKKFINANIYRNEDATEILVEKGVITQIGKNLPMAEEEIDLKGRLVVPPYVDAHLHLDYVYTGRNDGATNDTGTLFEGIARWHDVKKHQTYEDAKERALRGIQEEVSKGVQFIRTHIDVDDPKLTGLKAMLEIREELKDNVTIQIVAFPQEGMYAYKGGDEMVEEALKMGADCVGSIPHFEWAREIGEKSIHKTVELAVKYDKLIDVHCDETDDVMSRFVELLNALAMAEGIGPRTAASHTCSFGSADNAYAFRMMGLFQKSGLNFIALPTENAYLQGRQDTYPKRRGLTRVKEFWESGINVCFGQDSINDPWYPAGNGNLMNILDNGIHLAQTMSFDQLDTCLDLITFNGAKTLNIEDQYGIEAGKPANFLVLDATTPFEAVRQRADVLASIRNGNYLFKKPEPSYEVELDLFRQTR